jgi:predicted secreted protein
MPTTGFVSGSKLRIFVGNVAVARATDCSVEFDVETESVSTKDSTGGWTNSILGDRSGKGQCEMLIEEVAGGWASLFDAYLAGTAITISMTTGVVGDLKLSGSAFVTSAQLKGTHKQAASGSISFTFNGVVTKGVAA